MEFVMEVGPIGNVLQRDCLGEALEDVRQGISYGYIHFPDGFAHALVQKFMDEQSFLGGIFSSDSTATKAVIGLDATNFQIEKVILYAIHTGAQNLLGQLREICPLISMNMGWVSRFIPSHMIAIS